MYKQYNAEWAAWVEDPNNLRGRLWSLPPPKPPPLADRLHPTLSSWLKNMNKLDGLINRLQELASSALPEHRSQLLNKVVALGTTFKRQQERFISFCNSAKNMPINICKTSPPRSNNRAPFWTIWKSAWKPRTSYMERPQICKCITSLGQLLI